MRAQHRKPAIRLTRAGWAVTTVLGLTFWAGLTAVIVVVLGGAR